MSAEPFVLSIVTEAALRENCGERPRRVESRHSSSLPEVAL
jgi:hypothetical protein